MVEKLFELDGECGACGVGVGLETLDGVAGAVEQEFGVVPVNGSAGRRAFGCGEEIDERDGEDAGKFGRGGDEEAEILLCVPGGDGGRIGKLLVAEVGGGNAEQDKAARGVGLLKLGERGELRGVEGLAGEVDDEQNLAAISRERLKLAVRQNEGEIPGGESGRGGV